MGEELKKKKCLLLYSHHVTFSAKVSCLLDRLENLYSWIFFFLMEKLEREEVKMGVFILEKEGEQQNEKGWTK